MIVPPTPPSQTIVVEAHSAQAAIKGCSPIPGFSSGDVDQDAHYLLLGMIFGTDEFVARSGDIICSLSAARPLTVALPYSTRYSQALSAYTADPHDNADKALSALPIWDKSEDDGRNSAAMFQFIRLLRRLRLAGRDIEVSAYWPAMDGDDNDFQAGIAEQLKSFSAKGKLVVALMAGSHAAKMNVPNPRNMNLANPWINPAGNRLPSDQVLSIHFEAKGGTAWGWLGAHHVPKYGGGATLWSRYAGTIEGYDGRLFVGGPVTASPPFKY